MRWGDLAGGVGPNFLPIDKNKRQRGGREMQPLHAPRSRLHYWLHYPRGPTQKLDRSIINRKLKKIKRSCPFKTAKVHRSRCGLDLCFLHVSFRELDVEIERTRGWGSLMMVVVCCTGWGNSKDTAMFLCFYERWVWGKNKVVINGKIKRNWVNNNDLNRKLSRSGNQTLNNVQFLPAARLILFYSVNNDTKTLLLYFKE